MSPLALQVSARLFPTRQPFPESLGIKTALFAIPTAAGGKQFQLLGVTFPTRSGGSERASRVHAPHEAANHCACVRAGPARSLAPPPSLQSRRVAPLPASFLLDDSCQRT